MKDNSNSSTARFVIGIVGMVVFGILFLIFLISLLVFSAVSHILLPIVIVFAAIFVLSGLLMNSGLRRKRVIARLSRYMAELSSKKDVMTIEEMAGITGYLPGQILSDTRWQKRWDLNFDLYTDKEETSLIKGKGAYAEYLDSERQRETFAREEAARQSRLKDPETATLETFRTEGSEIMDKLRAANLLLPGEAISNNLAEIEKTSKRIFDYVESHPEKLPETRKLMSYHLPTTLKLIDKYCQYDTMEYQPQNIADAKADIEKAIAAAREALANFLESLYHEDTLDVTTDAEVLTKMFEKDGLTGNRFEINNNLN